MVLLEQAHKNGSAELVILAQVETRWRSLPDLHGGWAMTKAVQPLYLLMSMLQQ